MKWTVLKNKSKRYFEWQKLPLKHIIYRCTFESPSINRIIANVALSSSMCCCCCFFLYFFFAFECTFLSLKEIPCFLKLHLEVCFNLVVFITFQWDWVLTTHSTGMLYKSNSWQLMLKHLRYTYSEWNAMQTKLMMRLSAKCVCIIFAISPLFQLAFLMLPRFFSLWYSHFE